MVIILSNSEKASAIVEPKKFRPFALILSVFAFVVMWGAGMHFGLMRVIGEKAMYYYNDVVVIMYDGKLQSIMRATEEAFKKMK